MIVTDNKKIWQFIKTVIPVLSNKTISNEKVVLVEHGKNSF